MMVRNKANATQAKFKPWKLKKCSFYNCNSTSFDQDLRFHNFRKADKDVWIGACKNDSLRNISLSNLLKHRHVCDKHFSSEEYTQILPGFGNKLVATAVPKELSDGKSFFCA